MDSSLQYKHGTIKNTIYISEHLTYLFRLPSPEIRSGLGNRNESDFIVLLLLSLPHSILQVCLRCLFNLIAVLGE